MVTLADRMKELERLEGVGLRASTSLRLMVNGPLVDLTRIEGLTLLQLKRRDRCAKQNRRHGLVRVTIGDDHSSEADLACHRLDGLVRVRRLCAGADDKRPAGQPGVQGAGVGFHLGRLQRARFELCRTSDQPREGIACANRDRRSRRDLAGAARVGESDSCCARGSQTRRHFYIDHQCGVEGRPAR